MGERLMQVDTSARLPLGLLPKGEEPLLGYIQRLCEENGIPRTSMLKSWAGLRGAMIANQAEGFSSFAQLTGLSPTQIQAMAYFKVGSSVHFFGHRLWSELLTIRHRRVCPLCLAERPHHRARWDLSIVSVCTRHRVKLVTVCQSCTRLLCWQRGSVCVCRCGFDLRRSHYEVAGESPGTQLLISHLEGRTRHTPQAFRHLSFAELASTLYRLGWYLRGSKPVPQPAAALRRGIDPARVLDVGYLAMTDWPRSFDKYLSAIGGARPLPSKKSRRESDLYPLVQWLEGATAPEALRHRLLARVPEFMLPEPRVGRIAA